MLFWAIGFSIKAIPGDRFPGRVSKKKSTGDAGRRFLPWLVCIVARTLGLAKKCDDHHVSWISMLRLPFDETTANMRSKLNLRVLQMTIFITLLGSKCRGGRTKKKL